MEVVNKDTRDEYWADPPGGVRAYFEQSRTVVSPTADGQRWQVPDTDTYVSAEYARQVSHEVRTGLGSLAL